MIFAPFAVCKHYREGLAPKTYFLALLRATKGNCHLYLTHIEYNSFVPRDMKDLLAVMYATMMNCTRRWQWALQQRYPIQNDSDLSGTPFSEYRRPDSFILTHDRARYQFKHSDMHNMITNALLHSYELISTPQDIRNPYTGVVFTNEQLWLIWLRMKHRPPLFTYLLSCEDLDEFACKYEGLIRSHVIKQFQKSLSATETMHHVHDMLYSVVVRVNNEAHPMVSVDKLSASEIVHMLNLYFTMKYSLNPSERDVASLSLLTEILKASQKMCLSD